MEIYFGPVTLDDNLMGPFTTDPGTGVVAAPTGTPQYEIYSADLSTTLVAATNATQIAALTGCYHIPHAISTANGFEAGKHYVARITYVLSGDTRTKLARFSVT
jgi:hypothetical protein